MGLVRAAHSVALMELLLEFASVELWGWSAQLWQIVRRSGWATKMHGAGDGRQVGTVEGIGDQNTATNVTPTPQN